MTQGYCFPELTRCCSGHRVHDERAKRTRNLVEDLFLVLPAQRVEATDVGLGLDLGLDLGEFPEARRVIPVRNLAVERLTLRKHELA